MMLSVAASSGFAVSEAHTPITDPSIRQKVKDQHTLYGEITRNEERNSPATSTQALRNAAWVASTRAKEGLVDLGILGNQRRTLDDCGGERPLVGANVNFEEVVARCIGKDTSKCPYDGNIGCWNTSLVTDMTRAFSWQEDFNEPIGLWDLSSVTDTTNMFRMASSFNQPLDSWDTSRVITMNYMFGDASSFNQPLNSWDTSKVQNFANMFRKSSAFNQPLDSWQTSNAFYMSDMFYEAESFNGAIGSWNTSRVKEIFRMFSGAKVFNQDIGSWDTSNVGSLSYVFSYANEFNQNIDSWQTSSVTDMHGTFAFANGFNQPLGSWDTSSVAIMYRMFQSVYSFNQPIDNWNVSSVVHMGYMFYSARSFDQCLSSWATKAKSDCISSSEIAMIWGSTEDAFDDDDYCFDAQLYMFSNSSCAFEDPIQWCGGKTCVAPSESLILSSSGHAAATLSVAAVIGILTLPTIGLWIWL